MWMVLVCAVAVATVSNADEVCTGERTLCTDDQSNCQEKVKLYDGLPNEKDARTTSLVDAGPAHFSKVSRFADNALETEYMMSNNFFHISANGDHMGWYMLVPTAECLREAKKLVAQEIASSRIDRRGPHRLVDEEGNIYPDHTDSPHLHLLLPRESFVHEAVQEGFERILGDGTVLKTLSLSPRVFLVDPILSVEDCNELIESSTGFERSRETHYAPGYENYRTSMTGHMPGDSKVAQKLWWKVKFLTKMPDAGVEFPQPLKYETNISWYKAHKDYFHSYDDKPLEDLRIFVKTRALELVRLREEAISDALFENSYNNFDNTKISLRQNIGARLATDLGLQQSGNVGNERQLIHYHLRRSREPIRDFSLASVKLAAQLLQVNGATDPLALAEKYFQFEASSYLVEDYVPYFIKHVEWNRHATVLPILGEAEEGGHTAFPYSNSTLGIAPSEKETIQECKRGLLLKPSAGQALLFYNRLPTGEKDERSEHAGCTVNKGLKFATNCFTWDADQRWALRFQTPAEELYQ
mmetsp:Transcript_60921/g.180375  ORF Transcript_60921/g.180375 Transcript_60921/m.180375 type:complete len:527 (-) Transcript_60921:110-1690(-)